MKKELLLILSLILIGLSALVYSIVSTEFINPADGFYLIKGGAVMGNLTFTANATPSSTSNDCAAIQNITLYTNISGTWSANYTNNTIGSCDPTETERIFIPANTNIFSANLANGLKFIWNAYACDNVSAFKNEPVTLNGLNPSIGNLLNYPVSVIDGIMNDTGLSGGFVGVGLCNLTAATGALNCNSTGYNGTDWINNTNPIWVNYTISSTCRYASSNRTVYAENAPAVTVNSPTTGGTSQVITISLNLTVTGDSSAYNCDIYSNDTGTWQIDGGSISPSNNSPIITSRVFDVGTVKWNAKCSEVLNSNIYGWVTSNQTITVGTSDPSITINSPADDSYSNYVSTTSGYSALINLTVTDNNPDSCILKINGTSNQTKSYTSGTSFLMEFNATDGNYEWNALCNNTIARTTETSNRTITIDTVYPKLLRNINYSVGGTCKGFTVEFNFSESVNSTLKYGLTSGSQTHSSIETDYAINQTLNLTSNNSYETLFYANITAYDRAGNFNNTIPELQITSPIPLCAGWSIWSVYDRAINMSDLYKNSGAGFVYFWNITGQSWDYYSSADTSKGAQNLGIGDVMQLYTATNRTYFRNNTGTPSYHKNMTNHVYLPVYISSTFGNFSYGLLRNETGGNVTPGAIYGAGGKAFQIDYLSAYNNTAQKYVSSIYKWSINNGTSLGNLYKNGLDTLWIYSSVNITINVTTGGEIIGNWT